MVLVREGSFEMGTPRRYRHSLSHVMKGGTGDDERPVHRVTLGAFCLDRTEVTNAAFARFIEATGYATDAERSGSSLVFRKGAQDWETVEGADWRHPTGPDSSIAELMDHPVVNVSWNDAAAYAAWAGRRVPTEAEWEYAARGGREGTLYPWGDARRPSGRPEVNFWQGTWPEDNTLEDGFYYTAPVASFVPTGAGLYDMIGNVWEWTADWYAEDYYKHSPSKDPKGPPTGELRVARGGSWFCSETYCSAYRVGFRGTNRPDASANNTGFRCARDPR